MGFSISEITQTRGWKNFMSKVYGIGASVVLIGAMFKIMHWPMASVMIVVGLSTEAFIFFTSAFEPLHQEWDWSLAYPELAGMHDEIEDEDLKKKEKNTKKSALEKFDELLNGAEITPELFEKLGHGLHSLNETTEKLSDVSDASIASNNYIASFDKASSKVTEFADLYGQSAQTLNNSANNLSKSYEKSAEIVSGTVNTFSDTISQSGNKVSGIITESGKKLSEVINNSAESFSNTMTSSGNEVAKLITSSGANLSDSYNKLANAMNAEFDNTLSGSKNYSEQLQVMSKNLVALNSIYELQLQGSNEYLESSKQLFAGMDDIMVNMKNSADDVKKYRDEISKLGTNLSAMNTIYGNMLSAMNFSK